EARFATRWQKIEAKGGCATVGDSATIEQRVDNFVTDVVAELPATTTTTTTTTSTVTTSPTSGGCVAVGGGTCSYGSCPSGYACGIVICVQCFYSCGCVPGQPGDIQTTCTTGICNTSTTTSSTTTTTTTTIAT